MPGLWTDGNNPDAGFVPQTSAASRSLQAVLQYLAPHTWIQFWKKPRFSSRKQGAQRSSCLNCRIEPILSFKSHYQSTLADAFKKKIVTPAKWAKKRFCHLSQRRQPVWTANTQSLYDTPSVLWSKLNPVWPAISVHHQGKFPPLSSWVGSDFPLWEQAPFKCCAFSTWCLDSRRWRGRVHYKFNLLRCLSMY